MFYYSCCHYLSYCLHKSIDSFRKSKIKIFHVSFMIFMFFSFSDGIGKMNYEPTKEEEELLNKNYDDIFDE